MHTLKTIAALLTRLVFDLFILALLLPVVVAFTIALVVDTFTEAKGKYYKPGDLLDSFAASVFQLVERTISKRKEVVARIVA